MKVHSGYINDGITRLLQDVNLPVSDLSPGSENVLFFYTGNVNKPAGVVGLEPFGDIALLRSLAVSKQERKKGLGIELVKTLEESASQNGIYTLYLLTTTAESYFQKLGYKTIPKNIAPEKIRTSTQFAETCPASSVLMKKEISDEK